jgi:hypothetical protein
MRAGKTRALMESAREAAQAWYDAADPGDRTVVLDVGEPFDLQRAFHVAAAVLPRGAALLAIGDFWDLPAGDDALVMLGWRFDCTALLARDPWSDGLPLGGFVRMRDAETGVSARVFLGKNERERYVRAVRAREAALLERFAQCGWRAGIFDESDGGAALHRAFGLA